MNKRAYADAFDEEPLLQIRLADSDETVHAELLVLRAFSYCARKLPDTEVWDLSDMRIDGQPVSRNVLVAWLDCAYRAMYDRPYDTGSGSMPLTCTEMYRLLAFADAIGSTNALVKVYLADVESLELHVKLGEQEVQLKTDGTIFYRSIAGPLNSIHFEVKSDTPVTVGPSTDEAWKQCRLEAAAQLEALLYISYKLKAMPLITRLHAFIRSNANYPNAYLVGMVGKVFSPRVMEAAQLSPEKVRKAWTEAALCTEFIFVRQQPVQQLLEPLNLSDQHKRPIMFDAILKQSFMGSPPGTKVEVEVDLFGKSLIWINGVDWELRHRIGYLHRPGSDNSDKDKSAGQDS